MFYPFALKQQTLLSFDCLIKLLLYSLYVYDEEHLLG